MSRPSRAERMAAKGRPRRRAAKTHFFKYQLANNPSRAEEEDLKRALQESLNEQNGKTANNNNITNSIVIISSTNSSDVSRSYNSSSSNLSAGSTLSASAIKRTRSSTLTTPVNKRAKLSVSNGYQANKCDGNPSVSARSPTIPQMNKAIRTYSRSQPNLKPQQQLRQISGGPKSSTPITKPTFDNSTPRDKGTGDKSFSPSSVSKSTQTPTVSSKLNIATTPTKDKNGIDTRDPSVTSKNADSPRNLPEPLRTPVQDQYLKFKRESKNYAYVKMTALKVSTSKSPSSNSKSNSKKSPTNGISQNDSVNKDSSLRVNSTLRHQNSLGSPIKTGPCKDNDLCTNLSRKSPTDISPKITPHDGKASDNKSPKISKSVQGSVSKDIIPKQHDIDVHTNTHGLRNDCSLDDTLDLSNKKNQNHVNVKVTKKRLPQGSWSLLGVPEEKVIYLRDDEPPRRLICYPAIKHVEGDVIQVRDSVLLRSGARKTDLPYIAKVCAFWEDAETGGVMMSLFWYYRPEHTEEGRKPHHLSDEIFASRHRDVDSVECIEDKCYVLTFNEYCRYKKKCKMEQVNTTWSLTDVTIPMSNESYPRRNRIPDSDVNPELVFCCRQIYDSRLKRLIKNPLINPKYGHI